MTLMENSITGFSFSALSMFKSCPRSFEYRYIKKIPEVFTSIETYMGSCVHEALEWAYAQRLETHEPGLDEILERYNQIWYTDDFKDIKIVKEEKSREDYYANGRHFIESYFRRVFLSDRSTTIYLEHKFELRWTENIIYRGVIDRIAKGRDGTIRVIDYKTGRVENPLDTLQLPSYALYIFQHNIDVEIELCYENLREELTVVVPFHRKGIKRVKEELLQQIQGVLDTPPGNFFPKPSILCLWCGYNTICDNPHESVKTGFAAQTGLKTGGNPLNREIPEDTCPLCGGQLRKRSGKFGLFWGCSHFPQCRYTRNAT